MTGALNFGFDVFGLNHPIKKGHQYETVEIIFKVGAVLMTVAECLANFCFVIILQTVWTTKDDESLKYIDPILNQPVPMVVYIKNRRLIRQKND